jgi:hypothetical protein
MALHGPATISEPLVDKVGNLKVGGCEPWAIVAMLFLLQVCHHHPGPIEPGAAIEAMLGIGQVQLHLQRSIRDLRLRRNRDASINVGEAVSSVITI